MFCAQAFGIEKSFSEQIVIVLMLMISSKGVAGVRGAAIVVLAATLDQFGIPTSAVGLILGVDWFMNMGRCFINVLGNCLAAVVMAKWENQIQVPVPPTILFTDK